MLNAISREMHQELVGDSAHLLNRIIDHTLPVDPCREANGNAKPTILLVRVVEELLNLPDPALDSGELSFNPQRRDAPITPRLLIDA